MKDAIHQSDYFNHPLFLFVVFAVLPCCFIVVVQLLMCTFDSSYKPLKCFLKCAFAMKLIQKNSNNNIIPIDKNVFHEF